MLYPITIFLSAFLLFQVQPLMGRFVLPWFGGTPAVWSVCLLFFQSVLLAGYGYAHWLGSLRSVRVQAGIHGMLLTASLLLLPVIPNASWKPVGGEQPQIRILLLLLATVGGPYFLLSSTTPLLQRWFTFSGAGAGWRLYALSNFGSFLALFSYPFLMEPFARLGTQGWIWSAGYAGFVVVCGLVALQATNTEAQSPESEAAEPLSPLKILYWLGLAATASALLLATTNLITQDVAVFPFLWILPLSVYLLSFILTFESERWYWRPVYSVVLGVMALVAVATTGAGLVIPLWAEAAVYLVALFAACMVCHGELARERPQRESLTAFYLTISAGGVTGGAFVALIAPNVFREFTEYPLGLAAACILGLTGWRRFAAGGIERRQLLPVLFSVMALVFGALGAMALAVIPPRNKPVSVVRNFFGVLRVSDLESEAGAYRLLTHGRIRHGSQYLAEPLRSQPTTYFGPRGGVGVVMQALQKERASLRIGVIGLGAGTLAAWGRPGDSMRFYEINPDDEGVARRWFTYLSDSKAKVDVALGDARIVLDREGKAGAREDYDIIVVDAFSSDAIPMHLLTAECADLYRQRLKPGGLLMVHISNRTLNLEPVVRGMAEHLGWTAAHFLSSGYAPAGETASNWMLLTQDAEFTARTNLKRLESGWTGAAPLLWTDDFASLWHVVRW